MSEEEKNNETSCDGPNTAEIWDDDDDISDTWQCKLFLCIFFAGYITLMVGVCVGWW